MMSSIHHWNVPTYQGGCEVLIYLVSSVERLLRLGLEPVFTDRNAALAIAEHTADVSRLDKLVDWELMRARMWKKTDDDPDRKERRMAECLVHEVLPWEAVEEVVVHNRDVGETVRTVLTGLGAATPCTVRRDWYF